MKIVVNRIKQIRQEKGIKQGQLADLISLRREALSGIERGRQNVALYSALEIADVFQMKVADIFYVKEEADTEAAP